MRGHRKGQPFRSPATEESNLMFIASTLEALCSGSYLWSHNPWFIPMIPQSQHWAVRKKNHELETSPGYLVRLCLKN